MDVEQATIRAPEITDHGSRGDNEIALDWLQITAHEVRGVAFVSGALLDFLPQQAAAARRLLVTSWLLSGGGLEEHDAAACRAAVRFWASRRGDLQSWRQATVTTVLFDLERYGLVESFSKVANGFLVNLREAIT